MINRHGSLLRLEPYRFLLAMWPPRHRRQSSTNTADPCGSLLPGSTLPASSGCSAKPQSRCFFQGIPVLSHLVFSSSGVSASHPFLLHPPVGGQSTCHRPKEKKNHCMGVCFSRLPLAALVTTWWFFSFLLPPKQKRCAGK